MPTTFTWYSSGSSFSAGRLDYIVYSDFVLQAVNGFSLHTPGMHPDSLQVYGLEADDTIIASDHLPLVGDFELKVITSREPDSGIPGNFRLHQNYPNPFNPSTNIYFEVPKISPVKLEVFDGLGRKVRTLFDGIKSAGNHSVLFEASDLPSGIYFYALSQNGLIISKKMLLVK